MLSGRAGRRSPVAGHKEEVMLSDAHVRRAIRLGEPSQF